MQFTGVSYCTGVVSMKSICVMKLLDLPYVSLWLLDSEIKPCDGNSNCQCNVLLPPTKEEVHAFFCLFVCLSVCFVSKITQRHVHGFG